MSTTTRPQRFFPAALAALALVAGCEEERATSRPKIKLRPVIGKRTQDVRDAKPELEHGGAKLATTKITAKDPITLPGNAYVTTVGRIGIMQIEHSLDIYAAGHDGKYPQTLQEFMAEIIKANNLALPTLPYYQEWGYDAPNHRLVILEYPDRKARFQEQQDRELGRR